MHRKYLLLIKPQVLRLPFPFAMLRVRVARDDILNGNEKLWGKTHGRASRRGFVVSPVPKNEGPGPPPKTPKLGFTGPHLTARPPQSSFIC